MAKPTINDVARIAGVSKKTVSRVINQSPLLNEATRAKVEQVVAELGYVPDPQARALALRRNPGTVPPSPAPEPGAAAVPSPPPVAAGARGRLVALVYDFAATPLLPDVQLGMLTALRGTDAALTVLGLDSADDDLEAELRQFLERQRPSGVLFLPPLAEIKQLSRLCGELGCDAISLGAAQPDNPAHLVASDDRDAAAQAIGYLISLGHERIGMVTGPDDSVISQARELGYLDAMADHDLDRGPALIATGDDTFQSGYAAGQLLLEVSPRPTAIFASNDEMAAGILHAAAQLDIAVPGALSIVGFEDTAIAARLCPQLTTVRVPLTEMARAAALKLVDPAAAASQPSRFTAELVVRASTGPCPV